MLPKSFGALAPFLLLSIPLSVPLSIPAFAGDLTLTLDAPATLNSPPAGIYQPALCQNSDGSGSCVIFTGTITTGADETQDYFLDSLSITMNPLNPDSGAYVFDNTFDSDLFGNAYFLTATSASGLLGPDAPPDGIFSYSGGVFEVDVEPGAALGNYFGTATLDYTDGTDCTDPTSPCSVSADFEVVVTPEPGAWVLAAAGLAALALMRQRFSTKAE